jgi:hypothetical protein
MHSKVARFEPHEPHPRIAPGRLGTPCSGGNLGHENYMLRGCAGLYAQNMSQTGSQEART